MSRAIAELEAFLTSKEADYGLNEKARILISEIPGDEDEAFKYFANIVVPSDEKESGETGDEDSAQEAAARSYRAMQLLKQDLATMPGYPRVLIKNPAQAGLLAKDLFAGLSVPHRQRYSTLHMRELLDALVEAYPEKVMAAASAGGKQGIQEHLTPLLNSDQTLPVLTHLVCYGCTGRKGIASAEKSAAHTQRMYQNYHHAAKIPLGQRKKFVRACMDFGLIDQLANALTASTAESATDMGEEVCEAILTTIELIGYPPDDALPPNVQQPNKKEEVMVGEDALLSPLATPEWWTKLLECLLEPTCSPQQRLAISRTCMQTFSLATGHSSRICKSHAPATDATEQTSETIVEEKEEHLTNRLVEWGLTEDIHVALVTQIPLIVQALQLPDRDVLSYNATFSATTEEDSEQIMSTIRHPGKYQTVPLGSWRLQLLALLKEILIYGKGDKCAMAMDEVMKLPLPLELVKATKGGGEEEKVDGNGDMVIFNPWPALCSYVWAYPNNDFYGIIFFEMFRSAVVEHHEATLRVILQKSKFLTKAVKTVVESPGPLRGVLLNCLNVLRLRAESLPPNAFLPQYLKSHDGWKEHMDKIIEMTIVQQTPIKEDGRVLSISLGSKYAQQLGMENVKEYDELEGKTAEDTAQTEPETEGGKKGNGKKKKKSNKKKKK